MGAGDESGGNKPHNAAPGTVTLPCGVHPDCLIVDAGYFLPPEQPRVSPRQQQQVAGPVDYAVVGKILLAAAGALAGVLLALAAIYLFNAALRRRRRQDVVGGSGGGVARRRLVRSPAIAGAGDDAAATPRGLDPAVLRALPVVVVAAAGAGDCAVCLAEVQPGEKARALPRCAHVFHAVCIDAWFQGNATCPLCRAEVVAPDDQAPPEVRIDVTSKASRAMLRLPSGTDLDKTRRALFASTRSVSF